MEAAGFLNDSDPQPEHVISDQDFPHRLTVSGIYDLPFGRGKQWLRGANRLVDAVLGGWQVQAWYEGQSGQALGFGNAIFTGNLHDIVLPKGERNISRWFNTANFERNNSRALANNIRAMSSRFTGVGATGSTISTRLYSRTSSRPSATPSSSALRRTTRPITFNSPTRTRRPPTRHSGP
jgi:hypothetical protein